MPARGSSGKRIVTSGGRVLCVTALGDSLRIARSRAYEAAEASASMACNSAGTSATAR